MSLIAFRMERFSTGIPLLILLNLIVFTALCLPASAEEKVDPTRCVLKGAPPDRLADFKPAPGEWTAARGWHGLVVGKSTLKDAERQLGKRTGENRRERCYTFKDGLVTISIDGKNRIDFISVAPDPTNKKFAPHTVAEAQKLFGPLKLKEPGKGSNTYQKPGITMSGNTSKNPESVNFIEFTIPN